MNLIAAIDIGTNSIRLEVVRVEDDHSLTTLSQQKETVRLGEGEFQTSRMTAAAIERGALVCAKFADVARGFGAQEIIAFATSAVREAENQNDFIERYVRPPGSTCALSPVGKRRALSTWACRPEQILGIVAPCLWTSAA